MKTYITTLLMLLFASNIFAGDRTVYIERFTSSTCPPCASQNPAVDAWFATQSPLEVIGVTYHMSWPAPGNDPMYHHNPIDNTARRNFYGVNSIPQGRFDGTTTLTYNSPWLTSNLQLRRNTLSPISITVLDSAFGDSVKITAIIYCETMMTSPNATIYMNVIEKFITNINPPSTNGETEFHDVMRKMLPTAAGTQVTLTPSKTVTLVQKFKMDPAWDPSQITVQVWAQASDKEVLNSATILTKFAMMPNPGYRVVDQGQSGSGTYTISIPYTGDGYNSAVQLSAVVEPANPNINVSFVGGNTISTFPGSVQMEVTSNSSVPAGVYKIVVSGTNTENLTRKIVVNYLVGMNFVEVGTNKGGIPFIVNGNNHSSTQLYSWNIGSTQTLEATNMHTVANTRYVFENWSNGATTNQQIVTVNSSTSEYTANYKTQFRILSGVNPAGLPVTVVNGNAFHDSAATVTVTVNPTSVQHNGRMYYFNRWFGSGEGSYNGPAVSFDVNMTNPINQIAIFDTIDVSIATIGNEIPEKFDLHQNYPNPFNPVTKINFDVAKFGEVSLKVFNILGEEIAVLHNGNLSPGRYEYTFDATGLSSGIYFYKIEAGDYVNLKRMVLIK